MKYNWALLGLQTCNVRVLFSKGEEYALKTCTEQERMEII